MADDLIFYTNPMSRGQTVRWMLEEVGHPYRTEILDYGTTMKGADYLAVNPMGKVPAIKHGDVVVTETPGIVTYLADAFPKAGLAPAPDSPRRGPYYRWLFFAAGPLEYAIFSKRAGFEPGGEQARMLGYGTVDATLDAVEGALKAALDGEGYLTGAQFTAADLYVGAFVGFGMNFGMIEKRPTFTRFLEKIDQRPARQRAQATDAKLIAEMQKA